MFVDYSFYSLIQLSKVNWNNSLGKQFIGWDWMPIRNDFKKKTEKIKTKKTILRIFLFQWVGVIP